MTAILHITVHEGRGLAGGLASRRDPYLVGYLGEQRFHTSVAKNSGKNPSWDETFALVYNGETELRLTILDKDRLRRDDLMGEGTLRLDVLHVQQAIKCDVPIEKKGKPAGVLRLSLGLAYSS